MTEPAAGPGTGEDDRTLGGYFDVHSRPPAFEAVDGQPYTVSIETERTGDLKAPVAGYLVFPRWAETGLGIVGHVESPLQWWGATRGAVVDAARAVTLNEVQRMLNEAVVARSESDGKAETDGRSETDGRAASDRKSASDGRSG